MRLKPSSNPTGPVGMMYVRTGMPTMNTSNHHGLVQIGLMRTIWTTVSQTPAQMNGIPSHTRWRTVIFHPLPLLPFFINLFYKPFPLLSISAASSQTLIAFWVGWHSSSYCSHCNKCLQITRDGIRILTELHSDSWVDSETKVWNLHGDFLSARKPCVWFLFLSPINKPCLLQCGDTGVWGQNRSAGLREGHSQHSSVCLMQKEGLPLCF